MLIESGISNLAANSFGFDQHEFMQFSKYILGLEKAKLEVEKSHPVWKALKCVVNGPIDADKFDYLVRDAHHAGVPYAKSLDPDRFLNGLVVVNDDDGSFKLAVNEKSISSAEMFAVGRYFMYTAVYYHHTVRVFDRMIIECVSQLASNKQKRINLFKQIKDLSDEGFLEKIVSENPDAEICSGIQNRQPFKRLLVMHEDEDEPWLHKANNSLVSGSQKRPAIERALRGKLKKDGMLFEKSDLLIDLPAERTQDNIIPLVKESGKPMKIGNLFWKSITDNFNVAARKLRVFVNKLPEAQKWDADLKKSTVGFLKDQM